ncbi:beta-ketoacyl-[acyl-carrier-protein] synthase family protein [Mixta theicola]|nr:beta-ketoacyl-[acyl-carrier-protein] synthase family protein [Mixta theicola]GLR08435.1 actinorhodin polyketide putative beta-ketoacyl synthase 1 [Mixta theicola]
MQEKKVVITGLGVIAPNGIGIEKFWSNTLKGISGIKPYEWGKRFGFKSTAIGRIDDFSPFLYDISERQIQNSGRYLQFALAAAHMAISDSGLRINEIERFRFGVMVASAIADAATMEQNLLLMTDNGTEENDADWAGRHFYDNLDFGSAAFSIARKYGAMGPVSNLSTGCTAGLDALGFAFEQIRSGKVDVMIAGASEAPLCPLSVGSFEALGALSTRDCADKTQTSCPFSAERDGFVIAEGCGIFVLEEYTHAVQRGAKIYAEVAGYASVNNAWHMTDLPSDGEALASCIFAALKDAKCGTDDIDHIGAHGSSTTQNDANETGAIKRVFGERAYHIPVNSLKAMTGHALAAANAIELVAMCLEIEHQTIFPTINYQQPDGQCDLDYVPNEARAASIRSAIKLSSGFSGIHSAVVLQAG